MKKTRLIWPVLGAVLSLTLASVPAEARKRKLGPAEAKRQCLEENQNLSGKELRRCIKGKMKSK